MNRKKTSRADLESKRPVFTQIGFVVALSIALLAFEWKTTDRLSIMLDNIPVTIIEQDELPVIIPELPKPEPIQKVSSILDIKDDNVEIKNEIQFSNELQVIVEVKPVERIVYIEPEVIEEIPVDWAEVMAEFQGGEGARLAFLRQHITYPMMARRLQIQGTVYVEFIVERDGSLTDIKIIRGIGGGCDEEALRVAQLMPKWIPAKQRGKPVRFKARMPIKFELR
ncbi:MAG: energy transducer TonB [Bacteroidales bacterium]|nr:energy transducer TonB [Bacteroidales bacterium]